ncbi:hypothetical protein tinsulaeT_32090 [Thalassotalea insulae]|uniref:Uncharacterized protein n=1 Tax=Thalassotalea insulae TaxID=2056778 RepID=A0ABQ6GXF4_9GAMM|nr:hypothetical protein [Thalassotalea insulae]GLX79869.1 hypothetical protein tinsulaeT_32090 [Thalassotalea insulae]
MIPTELPLSIEVTSELLAAQQTLTGLSNKLEALFNFRTMTAGWYGDEDCILRIRLSLETQQTLTLARADVTELQELTELSDDVFVVFDSNNLDISANIALTDKELVLIEQTAQLLQPLLDKKIVKTLNFIAEQQKLFPID